MSYKTRLPSPLPHPPPPCQDSYSLKQTLLPILRVWQTTSSSMLSSSAPRISCQKTNTSPSSSSPGLQTTSQQVCNQDLFPQLPFNIPLAMIFLNDNVLLDKKITPDMIKPRLLGHWGTCPGLVLIYGHLNRIIKNTGLNALFVVGPGAYSPSSSTTRLNTFSIQVTAPPLFSLPFGSKIPSAPSIPNIVETTAASET